MTEANAAVSHCCEHEEAGWPVRGIQIDVTATTPPTLAVRWVSSELVIPQSPVQSTHLPFAVICYAVNGGCVYEYSDIRHHIEPGMVFWQDKNINTILTAKEDTQPVLCVVALHGDEMSSLLTHFLGDPAGVSALKNPKHIETLINEIVVEAHVTSEHREENCALLSRVLLARIAGNRLTSARDGIGALGTYHRCRDFIDSRYATISSLTEVARACRITVPYLCRLFDQFGNASPYDYLTQLRLRRAEHLLLNDYIPISRISRAVGYRDQNLFARNFKSIHGISPTQFRKRQRGARS